MQGGPNSLVQVGPLVNVNIRSQTNGGRHATVSMMIDTGAQSTCVDIDVCTKLGLIPHRFQSLVGVSSKPEDCPVYRVAIDITMAGKAPNSKPVALTLLCDAIGIRRSPNSAHFGLLGRDWLSGLRLDYHGPNAIFDVHNAMENNRSFQRATPSGKTRKIKRGKRKKR